MVLQTHRPGGGALQAGSVTTASAATHAPCVRRGFAGTNRAKEAAMKIHQALNIEDLRRIARRRLPRLAFDYLDGGVEDEACLVRNRTAFDRYRLVPRYLVDVSTRDQSATLFGRTYASPF